jgi:hypothetical protein
MLVVGWKLLVLPFNDVNIWYLGCDSTIKSWCQSSGNKTIMLSLPTIIIELSLPSWVSLYHYHHHHQHCYGHHYHEYHYYRCQLIVTIRSITTTIIVISPLALSILFNCHLSSKITWKLLELWLVFYYLFSFLYLSFLL